jgi:hypothetical protein
MSGQYSLVEVMDEVLTFLIDRSGLDTVLTGSSLAESFGNGDFDEFFSSSEQVLLCLRIIAGKTFLLCLFFFDGTVNMHVVYLSSLEKQTILYESQFTNKTVDFKGLKLELVTVETCRSQKDVELVEKEWVVHRDWQVDVTLVTWTVFVVQSTCGTQVS